MCDRLGGFVVSRTGPPRLAERDRTARQPRKAPATPACRFEVRDLFYLAVPLFFLFSFFHVAWGWRFRRGPRRPTSKLQEIRMAFAHSLSIESRREHAVVGELPRAALARAHLAHRAPHSLQPAQLQDPLERSAPGRARRHRVLHTGRHRIAAIRRPRVPASSSPCTAHAHPHNVNEATRGPWQTTHRDPPPSSTHPAHATMPGMLRSTPDRAHRRATLSSASTPRGRPEKSALGRSPVSVFCVGSAQHFFTVPWDSRQ